jgi:multidrug transporter EmrE-like cation transporter
MQFIYLALAIASEITATSALKLSSGLSRPLPTMVMVIGYAFAFYFLSVCLKTLPLSIVYAVWAGVGTVGVVLVGVMLFRETIAPMQYLGISLIIAGVVLLNLAKLRPSI